MRAMLSDRALTEPQVKVTQVKLPETPSEGMYGFSQLDLTTVAEVREVRGRMALPQYLRIADDLREQIESGALASGDRLPTELNLRDQYSASRNTIRDAIKSLTSRAPGGKHGRARAPSSHRR